MDFYLEELKIRPQENEVQKQCLGAILDFYMDSGKGNLELVKMLSKKVSLDEKYSETINEIIFSD